MSISNRSNSSNLFDPNRTLERFTDRHELTRRFSEYLHSHPTPETILYFYGAGGNGKSLLLRFLQVFCCKQFFASTWQQLQSAEKFSQAIKSNEDCISIPAIYHDFALPPRGDEQPQDPFYGLLMLRRNLARATKELGYRLRFPLFDFACLWYLHQKEQLSEDRIKALFPSDALDLINEIVNLIQEIPGIGLAKTFLGILNKKTGEWFTLYRAKYGLDEADINEIKRLDPDRELIYELPRYFAKDLNTEIGQYDRPSKLILFFDTHEKFWEEKRQTQGKIYFYQDDWFRYLLRELELKDGIIVVVAGRELPQWHEATRYNIPQDCIDVYDVRDFFISDAIEYLQLAQIDEELQQAIINYSTVTDNQIHPFLLALCVDVVENAKKRNILITTEDFISQVEAERKPQELIDRLLKYVDRYVDRQVAYAVDVLSACREFDFELYRYLGEKLHFSATRPDFEILTGFSFVRREADSYRLHALLCRLNDEANNPTTRQAHKILEAYYREQGDRTEAIYHANRLDWYKGVNEWCEAFEEALKASRYGDCRTLLGVCSELNIHSYFQFAQISEVEGDYFAQLSRYEEAEREYVEAIWAYQTDLETTPEDTATLTNLGNALQRLGNLQANLSESKNAQQSYQQAIEVFNHALDLAPDYIQIHNNKGAALRRLGDLQANLSQSENAQQSYQQAIEAYSYALDLAPDYINAHNNKGNALIQLGILLENFSQTDAINCWQQALAHFSRSLELAPGNDKVCQAHDRLAEFLQGLE